MAKLDANNTNNNNHAYVCETFGCIISMQDTLRLEDGTRVTLPHPLTNTQASKVLSLMSGEWVPLKSNKQSNTAVDLDSL